MNEKSERYDNHIYFLSSNTVNNVIGSQYSVFTCAEVQVASDFEKLWQASWTAHVNSHSKRGSANCFMYHGRSVMHGEIGGFEGSWACEHSE